jgi:tRNA1(Val) A37 N6-methylase TrmN6
VAELFVVSLLSLYFELLVIRWLSSEIRIFAYFKNIPLMACLFGLGLGMALARSKKDIAQWFPIGLAVIVAIICLAEPLHLVHISFLNPLEHYLIGRFPLLANGQDTVWTRLQLFIPGLAMLVCVFYLIVFTFVALGQRIGALIDQFQPLTGYSVNVFASLLGILLFTLVSFLSLPPPIWLLIGVALAIPFYRKPLQIAALAFCLIFSFAFANANVRWSPYYRISVDPTVLDGDAKHPPFPYGYCINVNYDSMEGAYNNNPKVLAGLSEQQQKVTADYYDTPYIALKDKPRSVLILAAGTGNDVAAALRHGAYEVDAVEIDPTIAQLGRELHPEKPYSDPRVHVIVDDARAFMKRTKKHYDLVVFAYLDSHSAFSAMSSLRLDNYVYTKESFADAKRLLKPNGAISVTFYYLTWWQLARIYHSLEQGYGQEPVAVYSKKGNGPTLLVGDYVNKTDVAASGLKQFNLQEEARNYNFSESEWAGVCPTTDDWPYLFLRNRDFSFTYFIGLVFTLFLGVKLVRACFGKFTTDPTGRTMFFLGAAFMLIETKSVTQMGLLAGTTWIINACVIAGVLVMILLANLIQIKYKFKNFQVFYACLFIALLINFLLPLSALNNLPYVERLCLGGLILSTPLFFAAMIFASIFSTVGDTSKALGMNLLGSLIGGALEYLSMMVGINALNVLAAALYALALYYSLKTHSDAQSKIQSVPNP